MEILDIIKENLVDDKCILTNQDLSEKLNVSTKTVQRQLKKLEESMDIIVVGNGKARILYYRSKTNMDNIVNMDTKNTNMDTNMDTQVNLDDIPERYHEIFTTDWNTGSRSTMDMSNRVRIMNLNFEYIDWKYENNLTVKFEGNPEEVFS